MARVSKPFVDETLWPAFQEFSENLRTYLAEVTDRVVSQVIYQDSSEAEVVAEPKQLPRAVGEVEPSNTGAPVARLLVRVSTGPPERLCSLARPLRQRVGAVSAPPRPRPRRSPGE